MIKEGIEKEGVSRTFLHIRQLLLLQGCCVQISVVNGVVSPSREMDLTVGKGSRL